MLRRIFAALAFACALSNHASANSYTQAAIGMDRKVPTATPVCVMEGATCKIQLGVANLNTGIFTLPSYAALPSISANSILGNATGSSAAPQALTALPQIDIGGVLFTQSGAGAVQKTLADILRETITGSEFGLVDDPTCAIDQTTALRNFITAAAGRVGILPAGTFCIKQSSGTLIIAADGTVIEGQGTRSKISWAAPAGTAIAPVIDATGKRVVLRNFEVAHNASGTKYIDPTFFPANIPPIPQYWGGVAVVIEGDDGFVEDLKVNDGWDNCVGLGRIDRITGQAIPNSPTGVTVNRLRTSNCGLGYHPASANYGGAGLDNGNASATISNVIDDGSVANFVHDLVAGANGTWTNLIGTNAHYVTGQFGTGVGLYTGSGGATFSNVNISSAGAIGIIIDGPAGGETTGTVLNNIFVHDTKKQCLYIKGASIFNGVQCLLPSSEGAGASSAIQIDTAYASNMSPLYMFGVNLYGSNHTYSVEVIGPNNVSGEIYIANVSGTISPFNVPVTVTGLNINENISTGQVISGRQTFAQTPILSSLATGYVKAPGGSSALTTSSTIPSADFADGNTGTGVVAHATSPSFTTPTLGAASATSVKITATTVASLGLCDASAAGTIKRVSDASAPAYNATLTGGGAVDTLAYCNGTNWTAH